MATTHEIIGSSHSPEFLGHCWNDLCRPVSLLWETWWTTTYGNLQVWEGNVELILPRRYGSIFWKVSRNLHAEYRLNPDRGNDFLRRYSTGFRSGMYVIFEFLIPREWHSLFWNHINWTIRETTPLVYGFSQHPLCFRYIFPLYSSRAVWLNRFIERRIVFYVWVQLLTPDLYNLSDTIFMEGLDFLDTPTGSNYTRFHLSDSIFMEEWFGYP